VTGGAAHEEASEAEGAPPAANGAQRRKWFDWRILPLLAITGLVLWLLIDRLAGTEAFAATVKSLDFRLIPLALALLAINLVLGAFRWQLIMQAMGYRPPWRRCLVAILATWPLALIIPARAGDVLRAIALKDQVPMLEGAGSVVTEKAIDVQSLCLLAAVGTVAHGFYEWAAIPIGLFVAEWTLIGLVVRHEAWLLRLPGMAKIAAKASQVINPLTALMRSPRYLASVVLTSLGAWVLSTGIVQTLLTAADAGIGFGHSISLWPIAVFAGMLPLTVAGMGTRDALFVYALGATTAGVIREDAVLAATVGYSLVATWVLALVGLPFAIRFALTVGRTPTPGASS
jgi:hypothetical protein